MDEEEKINKLDNIDANAIVQELSNKLNESFSTLAKLSNYKFDLLVYKLVKKGLIKKSDMATAIGISEVRLYEKLAQFEKSL